jgi:hypothetical protein
VEGLQRQIRELSKETLQAVEQRDKAFLRVRDLEEQLSSRSLMPSRSLLPSVETLEHAPQEAFKCSEGDAEEDSSAVIAAMRARIVELETALVYAHERANTQEASGGYGEGKTGRGGADALSAGQERTWWEGEVRQKVEEVVRGLLGFAVAAREAEDEVWKLLDLVALEGAKMKEELVQTKENANAEAAQLNAEILSLKNMCAEQEEQVQALLELNPDFEDSLARLSARGAGEEGRGGEGGLESSTHELAHWRHHELPHWRYTHPPGGAGEEGREGEEGGAENGHGSDWSPKVNGSVHAASSSLDLSSVATPEPAAMNKVREGRSGQAQGSKRGKKKGAHLA